MLWKSLCYSKWAYTSVYSKMKLPPPTEGSRFAQKPVYKSLYLLLDEASLVYSFRPHQVCKAAFVCDEGTIHKWRHLRKVKGWGPFLGIAIFRIEKILTLFKVWVSECQNFRMSFWVFYLCVQSEQLRKERYFFKWWGPLEMAEGRRPLGNRHPAPRLLRPWQALKKDNVTGWKCHSRNID